MDTSLFSVPTIKQLCETYRLNPSKSYGQHYLISDAPVRKMLEAAQVGKSDTVVEVGPGFGALTFALAEKVKQVYSYEIEKKLISYWEDQAPENVEIIWGNVLHQFDPKKIGTPYSVIANLPYQITSAVFQTFLEQPYPPKQMVVMIQKEVADRICAKPGDMSVLSVAVQFFGEVKKVCNVSKGSFWPEPDVLSAVIAVDVKNTDTEIDTPAFFRLVRAGFQAKRKQLWKNLVTAGYKKELVKNCIQAIGLKETARAQELSIDEWKELFWGLGIKKLRD